MPTNKETNKPNGSAKTGNGSAQSGASSSGQSAASGSGQSGASGSGQSGAGGSAQAGANGGANGSSASDSGLLGGIQQKVTSRVDEQKNLAADGLGGIANAIRSASNELRNENETLASYVDAASDQMRRFADQIREKGVSEMLDDVNTFARRRPAIFIGGAFLVGIGIARFLKSSAGSADNRNYDDFSSVDPMTAGAGSPSYSGDLGEAGGY